MTEAAKPIRGVARYLRSEDPVDFKNGVLQLLSGLKNAPKTLVRQEDTDNPGEIGLQYTIVALPDMPMANRVAKYMDGLVAASGKTDLRPVQVQEIKPEEFKMPDGEDPTKKPKAQLLLLGDAGIELVKSYRDLVFNHKVKASAATRTV